MIAVTTQCGVRDRLRQVAVTLGFPAPTVHTRVAELPRSTVGPTLLFLDLGSCAWEPQLRTQVGSWLSRHPAASLILFVPLLDRDAEMHAMFDLTPLGAAQVMTVSDFARIEVWHNIVAKQLLATRQEEIRGDFIERVRARGRTIPAEAVVLRLLSEAPTITDVHAVAASALGLVAAHVAGARVAVWRELRRVNQLSATRLLLVFQLLWYRRLADLGWRSGTIAAFLGFRSARELRLTLKRRLGLRMHDIRATTYDDALEWAVASCSARDVTDPPLAQTKTTFLRAGVKATFGATAEQAFCG